MANEKKTTRRTTARKAPGAEPTTRKTTPARPTSPRPVAPPPPQQQYQQPQVQQYQQPAQYQQQGYAPQQPQQPAEPESFIVQNISKGPLFISDIGMSFGPLEVKDLTWEDPYIVKKSQDLRKAIMNGFLSRLSQDQWNRIMAQEAADRQAEAKRVDRQRRTRNVQADGRLFEAEIMNLNRTEGSQAAQDAVSTAGYANDPVTYATAFHEARAQYDDRGLSLDAHMFSAMVANHPSLVQKLLNGESMFMDGGAVSGDPNRGRATVLTPPNNIGDGMGVAQFNMTNFARDQQIAGGSYQNMSSFKHNTEEGMLNPFAPDMMPNMAHTVKDFVDLDNLADDDVADGYAEEIDLTNELGGDSGGGIRRL